MVQSKSKKMQEQWLMFANYLFLIQGASNRMSDSNFSLKYVPITLSKFVWFFCHFNCHPLCTPGQAPLDIESIAVMEARREEGKKIWASACLALKSCWLLAWEGIRILKNTFIYIFGYEAQNWQTGMVKINEFD